MQGSMVPVTPKAGDAHVLSLEKGLWVIRYAGNDKYWCDDSRAFVQALQQSASRHSTTREGPSGAAAAERWCIMPCAPSGNKWCTALPAVASPRWQFSFEKIQCTEKLHFNTACSGGVLPRLLTCGLTNVWWCWRRCRHDR